MKHSTAEHGGESATTRVRVEPSLPLTFGAPSVSNPPWPSEFEGVTDVVPPSPLLPMLPQPLLLPMPPSPPMPPLLENATTSVPSMPPLPLTLRPLTLDAPSVSNQPWPSEFEGVTELPMLPQSLLLPMPPSPPMPPLLENATTSVPSMPPLSLTLRPPSSGSSPQSPPPQPGGYPTVPNITVVQHGPLRLDVYLATSELGGLGQFWLYVLIPLGQFFGSNCLVALLLGWLCLPKWSCYWPLSGLWLKQHL